MISFEKFKTFHIVKVKALTGINTGLGCPPDSHQLNDPEDEDRDGLRNVCPYKTEPPYPADSPKASRLTRRESIKLYQIV